MLHEMGIKTEIDFNAVVKSAQFIEKILGKKLNSRQMDILYKGRKGCFS
jgi:isopropylmalate/homocitrate/citramalate synthase